MVSSTKSRYQIFLLLLNLVNGNFAILGGKVVKELTFVIIHLPVLTSSVVYVRD